MAFRVVVPLAAALGHPRLSCQRRGPTVTACLVLAAAAITLALAVLEEMLAVAAGAVVAALALIPGAARAVAALAALAVAVLSG